MFRDSIAEQVLEQGGVEGGIWNAGQVIGLIEDMPACAQLLVRMVDEARAELSRVSAQFGLSSTR